jgi:hypothetical protein
VKKGEEKQSFALIKNKQCDFSQKMVLHEIAQFNKVSHRTKTLMLKSSP